MGTPNVATQAGGGFQWDIIWKEADQSRGERKVQETVNESFDCCPNPDCDSIYAPIITRDGDLVCRFCGWLVGSGLLVSSHSDGQRTFVSYFGYNPLFHLNERIANLSCTDPRIPDDLFELVKEEHARGHYPSDSTLWYEDIGEILKTVVVPAALAEKYRGKRYKYSALTDMKKKFHERWITIRYRLTGHRPPPLDVPTIRLIQERLLAFLAAWRCLRHSAECRGGAGCHKKWGCRFKLPDNSFLIWVFMYDIGGKELAQVYEKYLFYDSKEPLSHCSMKMRQLIATAYRWNGKNAHFDEKNNLYCLEAYKERAWTQSSSYNSIKATPVSTKEEAGGISISSTESSP